MSDQKLRELERKWKETGSVEDEAAYLRERVRVGDLTQERLELAAYCGQEAARFATDCPDAADSIGDMVQTARDRWGKAEGIRLLIAISEEIAREYPGETADFAPRVLDLAGRWLHCPCPTCARAGRDYASRVAESLGNQGVSTTTDRRKRARLTCLVLMLLHSREDWSWHRSWIEDTLREGEVAVSPAVVVRAKAAAASAALA